MDDDDGITKGEWVLLGIGFAIAIVVLVVTWTAA